MNQIPAHLPFTYCVFVISMTDKEEEAVAIKEQKWNGNIQCTLRRVAACVISTKWFLSFLSLPAAGTGTDSYFSPSLEMVLPLQPF